MEKTFSLYPTNPTKDEDHIKNLNIRKSVGPYSIPNQILKEFNGLFSIPISLIFSMSPSVWCFSSKNENSISHPSF